MNTGTKFQKSSLIVSIRTLGMSINLEKMNWKFGRWANMTMTNQYCVDFESSMNQLWFSIEYSIINESSMIITTPDQCWSSLIISHHQKFYIRSILIILYNLWSTIRSDDSILIFLKSVKSILNRSS